MRRASGSVALASGPQSSKAFGSQIPTSGAGRKIIKPFVRANQKPVAGKKGTKSPHQTSEPKPSTSTTPMKLEDISLKECAEMLWFRQTVYASKVLKLLVWREGISENFGVFFKS